MLELRYNFFTSPSRGGFGEKKGRKIIRKYFVRRLPENCIDVFSRLFCDSLVRLFGSDRVFYFLNFLRSHKKKGENEGGN